MHAERSVVSWSFALGNLLIALGVLLAIFVGRSERLWLLDLPSLGLSALLLLSAFGLARATPWRLWVLRVVAGTGMAIGISLGLVVAGAALYAAHVHAALVSDDASTFTLVSALALPYLLLYPGAQLLWVQRQLRPAASAP
jgi:hypothetical protein